MIADRRVLVAVATLFAACGSKTGLDAPDAMPDAGTDAARDAGTDAGPPPIPCVEAPRGAGVVTLELELPAMLAVVDVLFLVDSTGSMQDEIYSVRIGLRDRVVPGVSAAIPDAAFGVALFGEFPVEPYGPGTVEPYRLRAPITQDIAQVEAALDNTPVWGNFDDPEADIEGLYQVATGAGYGMPSTPGYVPASIGCPSGGNGGACFRTEALPIVMLITDAPMHNGPPGIDPIVPYDFRPPPHAYNDAVTAVQALSALVLGLGASDVGRPSPLPHLRQLALDTHSVDASGQPLVFDIGGSGAGIGDEIVHAVERVASEVPLDVDAIAEDQPGDSVNANDVLRGVRAVRADPMSNVTAIDGSQFLGVVPGTRLTFELLVDSSELPPSSTRRVYLARVVFRAAGRARLDAREVEIVVPGDDGIGCEGRT